MGVFIDHGEHERIFILEVGNVNFQYPLGGISFGLVNGCQDI
jgi:hypothetical protein